MSVSAVPRVTVAVRPPWREGARRARTAIRLLLSREPALAPPGDVFSPPVVARRHARAFDEVVDPEGRAEARRPARREHVVRAGQVVPEGLGRILAEEHGAGVT